MSKFLVTGLAVLAIAFFVSACQPQASRPTPTPIAGVGQALPDLASVPDTQKVVRSTTTYESPGGPEDVTFTLILQDGVIVDAGTTVLGINETTQERQTSFAHEFGAAVEGKLLSELQPLDRIGGSSLTTKAFNDSIAQLQSQI